MQIFRRITFYPAILALFFVSPSAAQEVELGIWGGVTNSFGDINNSLESMSFVKPGAGVFFRYNYNNRIAGYIGLSGGQTYGYDSISTNTWQQRRNLSYRTDIYDASARFEFNFFPLEREKPKYWFSPYLFMGLSLYYFNPQAELNGEWVDLQPLGTEGQQFPELSGNDKYQRVQVGIPFGGGVKCVLNKNITVGLEANWHWLFTDYLDDVSTVYVDPSILASGVDGATAVALADRSTEIDVLPLGEPGKLRGDSQHNDKYMYAGIFLSYTFVDLKCPQPGWRHR
ncbi:MAG: DUF6089 family protein [Chitinophagales bacterium]